MAEADGATTVPELLVLAGNRAHLERERALGRIEQLLDGAGAQEVAIGLARLQPPPHCHHHRHWPGAAAARGT